MRHYPYVGLVYYSQARHMQKRPRQGSAIEDLEEVLKDSAASHHFARSWVPGHVKVRKSWTGGVFCLEPVWEEWFRCVRKLRHYC